LGERLICIQEVVGSTPIGSIPEDACRMTDVRAVERCEPAAVVIGLLIC
jgi:hypothetical protein